MVSSILDHKKHYSMCILNAFFHHMIQGYLDKSLYESAKAGCIKDIDNFYNHLLTGRLRKQGRFSKEVLRLFEEEIQIPQPNPPSFKKPEGESSARKMIVREMDHPMQILLFGGQIIDQDGLNSIDFVVNPLYGALEIGYALKSIYDSLGFKKIDDVIIVKYSRHCEGHTVCESLAPFVPSQLAHELEAMRDKKIFIIDDNKFEGKTLRELREMCYHYTKQVGIAAIERMSDLDVPRAIKYEELDVKPISKLRFVDIVQNLVRLNNLHGILNNKT